MTPTKILVIYSESDLVTRKMLEALAADNAFDIIFAAPADYADWPDAPCRRATILPIRSKLSWGAIRSLHRLLKAERPDVVYSISSKALSTALFASLGIKGIRNVGYRGTQARVHRTDPTYLLGILNPRVDHIVCETPDIQQYLQQYIPKHKLSMACKPFELEWVDDAMANPYDLDADAAQPRLQLINIGSSKGRPHKGMATLIQAMTLLADIPVHLTVVGEVDQADIDNAPANVTFLGYRTDAMRFLPKAHLLMLPSTRDASPRVLREAQACGVPCIVSDIAGARDLIVDGTTGILVPPASPQAIADAVRTLAHDAPRLQAMRQAARQHIAQNFRMQSYTQHFAHLFTTLAKK